MSLGLIIQQTNTGLENQYVSENLLSKQHELAATLTDERLLATQLANHSNVYSVQITDQYKVYSLIVTNVSDFVGRAGFIAIRLYVPKGIFVNDIQRQLISLRDRYLSFKENNAIQNQDYDDILNAILEIRSNQKEYISIPKAEDAVIYVEELAEVESVFHTKKCILFNKVYLFQAGKAVDMNVAIRQGMVPLEKSDAQTREIQISDPKSILEEMRINGQSITINKNYNEIFIICWDGDIVTYNTSDDRKFRTIHGNDCTIQPKFVPTLKQPSGKGNKKPQMSSSGLLIAVGLMVVALGFGIWHLFLGDMYPPAIAETSIVSTDTTSEDSVLGSQSIVFILDTSNPMEKDSVYKTNYPKLDKYRFKLEKGQWFFKNIKSKDYYNRFFVQTVSEISNKDSLSPAEKELFHNALTTISKEELQNKQKPRLIDEEKQTQNKVTKRQYSTIKQQDKKKENKEEQPKAQMKAKI